MALDEATQEKFRELSYELGKLTALLEESVELAEDVIHTLAAYQRKAGINESGPPA